MTGVMPCLGNVLFKEYFVLFGEESEAGWSLILQQDKVKWVRRQHKIQNSKECKIENQKWRDQ